MSRETESNINTVDYWDTRFGTGDWASKGGHSQTRMFAESQLPFLHIPPGFSGTICDFGCGAGDAFPVYHQAWPQAKLRGVDFSSAAIALCEEQHGHEAEFVCGDVTAVPKANIIICSNVLEHLDGDTDVVAGLLNQCEKLYVIVPYKEDPLSNEHVRHYDDNSFSQFAVTRRVIFKSRGWSEFGILSIARMFIENIPRYLTGHPIRRRRMQILFEITAS